MLVDNMIDEIRSQLDEANEEDVSDSDLLSALNRGQQKLVRLATRKYNPMFMREVTLTTADFTGREAELPEQSFAYIINTVEAVIGSTSYKIIPAHLSQMSTWDNNSSAIPQFYAIRGDKLLLYPQPAGVSIRVRYQIRPPKLALSQGRITSITDIASSQLYVDSLGSDLTTSISSLKAFVNVIDGTSGLVKSTHQIGAIDTTTKKLTIKSSSLDRSVVFGQTVSSTIPDTVALDDYITIADGTCIPTLVRDFSDFLIQFAVLEIKRRMGEPTQEEYAALKELEADVLLMWAGRPPTLRIEKRSKHWT